MGTFLFALWILSAHLLLLVLLANRISRRRTERLYPHTPQPPSIFRNETSTFQQWKLAYQELEDWKYRHRDHAPTQRERAEIERLSLNVEGCRMIYLAETGKTTNRLVARKKRRR